MKMKNITIFIILTLVVGLLPTNIFADTFDDMRNNIAQSLRGGKGKGAPKRPCQYFELTKSGKPADIEEIKSCMAQRKNKDARYYIDQYEIMYELIANKNNEGLKTLLKDESWNPSIVIRGIGTVPTGIYILDTNELLAAVPNQDQYLQLNTSQYLNLSLLVVATVFENKDAMEIIYNSTSNELKKRSLLFALDTLIGNGSAHFKTLYNFAASKTNKKEITVYSMIASIQLKNHIKIKDLAQMHANDGGNLVDLFKSVITEYYSNDYKKGADFSLLYDGIKKDIDTDGKNEILSFLIKENVFNKKLITAVLDTLTLEDIRDGFEASVLLDSLTPQNADSIDNLLYFIIKHSVIHSGNLRVTWGDSTISLFAYWVYKYADNGTYLKIGKTLYHNGASLDEVIMLDGKPQTLESLLSSSTIDSLRYL